MNLTHLHVPCRKVKISHYCDVLQRVSAAIE